MSPSLHPYNHISSSEYSRQRFNDDLSGELPLSERSEDQRDYGLLFEYDEISISNVKGTGINTKCTALCGWRTLYPSTSGGGSKRALPIYQDSRAVRAHAL